MITNKYKYPELKRIQNKLERFYIDSDGNEIPSVTTVLDNLSDKKSSLDQWRNRVGDIEADRVMKEATDIGTMVHLALENHLNSIDKDIFTDDSLGNLALVGYILYFRHVINFLMVDFFLVNKLAWFSRTCLPIGVIQTLEVSP